MVTGYRRSVIHICWSDPGKIKSWIKFWLVSEIS